MTGRMMHLPLSVGSLIEHAERYHARTPVVSVETDGSVTPADWGTVARNARRLASALDRLGVPAGARCATIAWNNRRHLEIYYGVGGGGRVTHTINPRLTPEQIAWIAADAKDAVLFIDRTFLPLIAKMTPAAFPSVRHFVLMGPADPEAAAQVPDLLFYDDLIATGDPAHPWPAIDETQPAALCYTSGTTGNPKGVEYSHRALVLHTLGGNQPDGLGLSARDTVLPVVPMFHVNAWGVPYIAAAVGCKLVLPGPGLDGPSLVRLIDGERVTIALGVPTIWMGLLATLDATGSRADSLTRTVVGGSAAPPSMIARFRDYGVELIHAWGMTETAPLGALNHLLQKHADLPEADRHRLRECQGRPPYGVELRVVEQGTGAPLPCDGTSAGELHIRGHWIVERYHGQDRSALTEDGWFDTGDIATLDPDGYLTIRDRSKDMIKSGGEWISTVELENIAVAHPGVANAAAIAAAHPKWDERPVLLAVRAQDSTVTEAELRAFYDGKVASWQVPDKVIFVDALPLGATGKILKSKLREDYGQVLMETA